MRGSSQLSSDSSQGAATVIQYHEVHLPEKRSRLREVAKARDKKLFFHLQESEDERGLKNIGNEREPFFSVALETSLQCMDKL